LSKDGSFVVNRTVFEMEYQSTGHAIAMCDLNEVTVGEKLSRLRAQRQKTMDQALGVANGDRGRQNRFRLEQYRAG
jgi:hypothetical protein